MASKNAADSGWSRVTPGAARGLGAIPAAQDVRLFRIGAACHGGALHRSHQQLPLGHPDHRPHGDGRALHLLRGSCCPSRGTSSPCCCSPLRACSCCPFATSCSVGATRGALRSSFRRLPSPRAWCSGKATTQRTARSWRSAARAASSSCSSRALDGWCSRT